MKKEIVLLTAVFALTAGYVLAQDADMQQNAAVIADEGAPAAIEVGNNVCPLSKRELNLNDPNDYTKLQVEGFVFNVCPKAKAEYDKDAAPYADKIAAAVSEARNVPAMPQEPVGEKATMDMPEDADKGSAEPAVQ